jgi:micrococcal nuclease
MQRKALILIIVILLTILGEKLPLESLPLLTENPQIATPVAIKETSTLAAKEGFYPVVRVVDGDTIVVRVNDVDEKIRLIGVNTPETVDPRKTVECFGEEASSFSKQLLENKFVRLERDTTQDDRDKYKRLLRYVYLEDETLFNKELISAGYAYEYTYKIPYTHQAAFKSAQRDAEQNKRGLWAPDACVK